MLHKLEAQVVTRLSAGPVITSVTDVVKELIECVIDLRVAVSLSFSRVYQKLDRCRGD